MRIIGQPTWKLASRLTLGAASLALSVFAACGAVKAQEPIQAIRLKEIKDIDKLDPNWIMGLCNLPGLTCSKVDVPRLFERKLKSGVEYYATLEGLSLARLAMKAPGQWQLLNLWRFADYPLVPRKDEEAGSYSQIDMHPALYPIGPDLWAIAVLKSQRESYSGGGAEFVTADFVALDPKVTEVREAQRIFGAVPFSCSKMIRACFSEKEYKTSPHCHDESDGHLTLKFTPSAAGQAYDWTATWHDTSWPSGVPMKAQTKTQTTAALKPGKEAVSPGTFDFCMGGPADQ